MTTPGLGIIPDRTPEQARADRVKTSLWYASAEPHLLMSKESGHVASFRNMEDRDAVLAMRDSLGPLIAFAEMVLRDEKAGIAWRTAAHDALSKAVRGNR
jgi:hypothetical protein